MSKERRVTLHASANELANGSSAPVSIDGMKGCAYLSITGAATGTLDVTVEEFDEQSDLWFPLASFTQASGVGIEKIVFPDCFGNKLRCSWTASVPGTPGWEFEVTALTKETGY